jgi:hypothetical protein
MNERIGRLFTHSSQCPAGIRVGVGARAVKLYQSTAGKPAAFREAANYAAAAAMGLPVPEVCSGQEIGGRWRSVDRVKQASFAEQKLNSATLWGRAPLMSVLGTPQTRYHKARGSHRWP